jgi:N-acetylglucosaminyl-diphospho-decaprenol L-rhamnosyltransferase
MASNSGPRLSAVVPSYNGGARLERCLDAVAASAAVDDVIVLDGGSTDGTDDRIERRPDVRVLRMPGTHVSERLNEGVLLARNELVLLLDDDAFVDPETPARLGETMIEHPGIGAAGARLRYEDGSPQRSSSRYNTLTGLILDVLSLDRVTRRFRRPNLPDPAPGLERATWLPLCAGVIRKAAFEQIGGFDPRFVFYKDDHDFAFRMTKAGWQTVVRDDAGAVHLGGAATSKKGREPYFAQYHRSQLAYLQKHYPRAWRIYAVLWAVRAQLHIALWSARALTRRFRSDAEGERSARAWVLAFRQAWRAPKASPPGGAGGVR